MQTSQSAHKQHYEYQHKPAKSGKQNQLEIEDNDDSRDARQSYLPRDQQNLHDNALGIAISAIRKPYHKKL